MTETITQLQTVSYILPQAGGIADAPLPGMAILTWHSDNTDQLFQAYVNGQLAGVTIDPCQRVMLVEVPTDRTSQIEMLSAEPENPWKDQRHLFNTNLAADGCCVELSWLRFGAYPLGSHMAIFGDDGNGTIDYAQPLARIPFWPNENIKWGFALAPFGQADFGHDATNAPGFGEGSFAEGEFGFDAERLTWHSKPVKQGTHKFALCVEDKHVQMDASACMLLEMFIDPLPPAPALTIAAYNNQTDQLTLEIT